MFVFICDIGYWMMNDEDAYAVMLRSVGCEQRAPLQELCIVVNQQKCPRNDVSTACRGRKWGPIGLHMRSKCMSLRSRTWLDVAKGPQGCLPQLSHSILGSFWDTFWRIWKLKRCQKTKSVLDVLLGSKLGPTFMDFGTKFEPNEDDTLVEVLKCAKSIFEQ